MEEDVSQKPLENFLYVSLARMANIHPLLDQLLAQGMMATFSFDDPSPMDLGTPVKFLDFKPPAYGKFAMAT